MKILFCGLGSICQRHLRNINMLFGEKHEIIAFRSIGSKSQITENSDLNLNIDIEKKYNIKAYYDIYDALSEKPEICFVCNPTSMHVKTAIDAANIGCHLFIEKTL